MEILSLLLKVEVHLVADEEFVAAVAGIDGGGIHLVGIAHHDAVYVSSDEHRHGVCGRISCSHVHHLLLMRIDEACGDVAAICHSVGAHKEGRLYCKKRTSQLNIASAGQIIGGVHLQLVGLAETDEGRIDVLCGDAGIPVAVGVIESDGEVERVAVHL